MWGCSFILFLHLNSSFCVWRRVCLCVDWGGVPNLRFNQVPTIPPFICPGPPLEEKPLPPCGLSEFGQAQTQLKTPDAELSAAAAAANGPDPRLGASNWQPVGALPSGSPSSKANKASEQNLSAQERGEHICFLQSLRSSAA